MKIEVHIRNGRTAFRFAKRADFTKLLGQKPGDDKAPSVGCQIRHNADDKFVPARARFISPNSVSFVLELPRDTDVS